MTEHATRDTAHGDVRRHVGEEHEPVRRGANTPVVGAVDDPAEHEAVRVATEVMRTLSIGGATESDPLTVDSWPGRIRRRARRDVPEVGHDGGPVSAEVESELRGSAGRGEPLQPSVRAAMEPAFGRSFEDVTVHRESRIARRLGAEAFTLGNDVHFAPGVYSTNTSGLHTIAHELAHTVQQSGTVGRRVQRKASQIADHAPVVESVSRALRLMRDSRFGSADRECKRIPSMDQFGSRTASHATMKLKGLEDAKERAKVVGKQLGKNALAPTEVAKRLSASASDVFDALTQAQAQVDAKYLGDVARIGAKAVAALAVGLTPQVLAAEPQVQDIFGQGGVGHGDMISAGKARVNELIAGGEFDSSGFHGTSSPILAGLKTGGGELLSMAELSKKNIAQTTGEGDTLSTAAGLKDTISIGIGEEGLGTSATYAALGMKVTHYNVTLYTYKELTDEIAKLDVLSNVANIKPNKVEMNDLVNASAVLGVPAPALVGMIQRITPDSAKSLKKRLEDEKAIRDKFKVGDPRREGGATNATTYPILFEFSVDPTAGGVTATKAGALPGEGFVNSRIPLATTLRRAWCPAENVATLTSALKKLFPATKFEVLPLEALQALPRAAGRGGEVLWSTYDKMKGEAAKMETARDLLAAVANK